MNNKRRTRSPRGHSYSVSQRRADFGDLSSIEHERIKTTMRFEFEALNDNLHPRLAATNADGLTGGIINLAAGKAHDPQQLTIHRRSHGVIAKIQPRFPVGGARDQKASILF